mmetsp:Transcript_77451/g.222692  ORF Transcript_77451/g.222692 Transcript_77451/m.222692 type:complete len:243 (-) Transcript_77451:169-897(-)
MVARVSSLILSSLSASSYHGTRYMPSLPIPSPAPPPSPSSSTSSSEVPAAASNSAKMAFISSYNSSGLMLSASRSSAALKSTSWNVVKRPVSASPSPSPSSTSSLSPPSRLFTMPTPLATSRGPTSRRSGTPLRSHSKYLAPGRMFSRWSTLTRTPAAFMLATASSTALFTEAASSGVLPMIGTTTTWIGATAGGSTRPASSECVMIRAPMRRVETPQLVAHTSERPPSESWNSTSNARAKF